MRRREKKSHEAVWCALVFGAVLLVAYLVMGRVCEPAPPAAAEAPQIVVDETEVELGMSEATFGSTIATGSTWVDVNDIQSRATAFPFPDGMATDSYEHGQGLGPEWPSDISEDMEDDPAGDHNYATYVVYDTQTLLPLRFCAYCKRIQASGGMMAGAVYTEAGAYVAGSPEWVQFATGEGWVELELSGSTPLSEGAKYCLWVCGNWDAMHELLQIRQGILPVALESAVEVDEALRTGVGLSSAVALEDELRVGVALASGVAVAEQIGTRNQPTDSGYCYGHNIRESDIE